MIKLTDEEYSKALTSKEAFEKILLDLYNRTLEDALKMLPRVTAQLIKTSIGLHNMTEEFIKSKPELAGKEDLLMQTIQQVEIENPTASYPTILTEAANRVRNFQLSLPKETK